ncbi:TonB-dependent receptor [Novosphingobium sp. ZN18A2]|uniref:TonB-dependent receptor plug domain-containing protein n=1 Tax=Novosphingobium sp. ZN18A2 TaxID=3079861 RepID=UPI0030CDDF3A
MKTLIPAVAIALLPASAWAQTGDDAITVLGTGSAMPLDLTGQPVTVIDRQEIDSIQGGDLTRVLERAPGVTFARNGGPGAQTALFVRGAASQQLLVLLDGVRMTDPSAPSGGTDLGNFDAMSIGKVELLRGSNSVIWGSDALGGVLALTSREANGLQASAEGGSYGTFDGQASAGIARDAYAVNLTGGYSTTDGVSAAATGTEPDGFDQWRIGGNARIDIATGLSFVATGRYAQGKLQIDGFPPPTYTFADTPEYQKTKQASGRAGLRYRSKALDLDAGFAMYDTRRAYFDPSQPAPYTFEYGYAGRSERIDLTGRWRLPHSLALDFGADSEWSRYSGTYDARQSANLTSGHAMIGYYGSRATLAAGLRVDDHSRFGSEVTFGANGTFVVTDGLRLRASYGQGFKAPTLYQLYSNYGNAALRPERSDSYDAGLEWSAHDGTARVSLSAFRRDTRGLIDYVSCWGVTSGICTNRPYGTYDNVGRARAQGIEADVELRPSDRLTVRAAYTYVEATDRTPGAFTQGNDLSRRPRNALTLSADWTTPLEGLKLGGDVRMVSDSFDDAANTVRLDGYALATLRASVPVGEHLELFGRIENLFDVNYQAVAGYGTYGRAAFAGVRVRM